MDDRDSWEREHRVRAVLAVLGGDGVDEVAERIGVTAAQLERWVQQFGAAGARALADQVPVDPSAHDRFLMLTSHELRTPVAVLLGWIDTISTFGEEMEPTTLTSAVSSMRSSVDRLARLADDLLDTASVGLGRLRLQLDEVDVHDLAARVVAELDPDRLALRSSGDTVVRCDVARMRQLLVNLVEDALRRAVDDVDVRLRTDGSQVMLSVEVPGDPPPAEEMLALFEPFERPGTHPHAGLGLYVSRALAVAHGGECGVEAATDAMTMWVRLPVDGPAEAVDSLPALAPGDDTDPPPRLGVAGRAPTERDPIYVLACGDVMPGCSVRFATGDRDRLMTLVAGHATSDHGLDEVTEAVADEVAAHVREAG